ncbi:MAG: TRAP transporter small permease subunit [Peptoniphilaceae bacterium]|nr:TRAP transporter small permease subunit [Peptoniphilaceae bacterium]MDY6018052.1 TRAP transporter small permease subunit [Anaerococcus sp.]
MKTLLKSLNKILKSILSILLISLVIVVSYVALMRSVFSSSPAWGESVALLIMVWFCLLSAALGVMDKIHIRMTILDNFLNEKIINNIEHLTLILWMIIGVSAIIFGIKLTTLAGNNIITGIYLPASVMYSSIPVFGVIVLLSAIEQEVELCKQV